MRCRSCSQPIIFALTAKGRRSPLDAEPAPDGNIDLQVVEDQELLAAVQVEPRSRPNLYRSHFASCPDATRHRRRS